MEEGADNARHVGRMSKVVRRDEEAGTHLLCPDLVFKTARPRYPLICPVASLILQVVTTFGERDRESEMRSATGGSGR